MRAFRIRMPSGDAYWTVIDDDYEVQPVADRYLRELRFGRDRAESTTKAYAESVSLFLRWALSTRRDWSTAARDLGLFIVWLKHTPARSDRALAGPGVDPVRGASRINKILTATRGFLLFAVTASEIPSWVTEQLYEVADSQDLPMAAQNESGDLRYRMRARHGLHQPETAVDRATDAEIVALFKACRNARDRLIVFLLARAGLRRGEAAGLRRCDLHLLPDNSVHDCSVAGAHLHVVRRANPNGAWAKSRRQRMVPLDFLTVRAIDLYLLERDEQPAAANCDFMLVNLFREPLGAPISIGAINELFTTLGRRAQLPRGISPHQGRHAFASNLADSGAMLDEIQTLLGHASPQSSKPYLHPSAERLRTAIDSVPSPREMTEGLS
ncbi:tyrosine-type recombinase/integrase [Rhodococcus erythropolis]|uniref:tyrosine-type recombinase/integrase n=1 Tax=Rhodococcus erythropolis TaxID=1833 RepID=UPI00294996BF|nr:tyrosine-type recombinase/integrase [Rhodococcus erythropolis]MDV6278490.1 tyrosine-type recombinase/integrase [Rhodococcus erythropolis]